MYYYPIQKCVSYHTLVFQYSNTWEALPSFYQSNSYMYVGQETTLEASGTYIMKAEGDFTKCYVSWYCKLTQVSCKY